MRDLIVDLRKDEQMSSIPWLNKKLLQFELTPYLRKTAGSGQSELERRQAACHERGRLCRSGLSWSTCASEPLLPALRSRGGSGLGCRLALCCLSAASASANLNRDCRKRST